MYKVKWEVGNNKWELGGPGFKEAPSTIPQMMHDDVKIKNPTQISIESPKDL
jgi:hypothetical protein